MNRPIPFYFGKVPAYADFVAKNAEGELCRAFDRWVRDGMHAMQDTPHSNEGNTSRGFFFRFTRQDGREVLLGRLWPSRDKVGRSYPFWCGFRIPTYPAALEHITSLYEPHLVFLESLHPNPQPDDLSSFITLANDLQAQSNSKSYYNFIDTESSLSFLSPLLDAPNETESIVSLFECLAPLSRLEPKNIQLGIRVPIGAAPPSLRLIQLRIWVDVILRIAGYPQAHTKPQLFWSPPEDGKSQRLTFFFRVPKPADFANILDVNRESDSIYDLSSSPTPSSSKIDALYRSINDLLASEQSVRVFLEKLQQVHLKTT